MRSIYLCCFFMVCLFLDSGVGAASPVSAQTARQLHDRSSVVKIFSVKSRPSYYQPWRNYADSSSTGSGVAIPGNRILTNAHNIANQTFIQVRKQGDQRKYVAKLEIAGHECDLAILSVNDPDFFKRMSFMEFGNLPHLQDKVNVLGYPVGGDNISVTEGVVSRIEPVNYSHSGRKLLAVQIDAAINPGNSGGPVVKDGKIVGLAFQGLSQSQNIGYIIPVPVIKHFLEDIKKNKAYKGFPEFSVMVMPLENPDMRKWLKMKDDDTGVMVVDIPLHEKVKNIFMENDVILEVDGVKIANDGTIPFRDNEVVFYEYLFWEKHIGDICKLKILRDGKVIELEYP
ncbi:MAG: serine protease, partial [Victivallales bacterium]|nr:serine protease [Victivallales bacterium]